MEIRDLKGSKAYDILISCADCLADSYVSRPVMFKAGNNFRLPLTLGL